MNRAAADCRDLPRPESGSPSPELPPLVRAMLRPEVYPHRPGRIELRQTHISWVFLAGEEVYKVKKPVRFEFLDYSTLGRRLYFCREEVRLNRRLAAAVYLGVVPILASGDRFRVSADANTEGHWPVAEYAVRMRRLPSERMLDSSLRSEAAGSAEIRAIAARLASFHAGASTARASVWGRPEAVAGMIARNFTEAEDFGGDTVPAAELAALGIFCAEFAKRERNLLSARLREGKVREGHGDLRAEHVCLTEAIDIFDCVEFSEELRYADVASEIAFLTMDLDFLGEAELARELVAAYSGATGDRALPKLIPFYACYRASVRGKVESLRSREPEVPADERRRSRLRARRYFRLAHRYTRSPRPPALVVVCGPSGTGKTTVARLLAADTGYDVLSSDVVRKRLAGLSPTTRVPSDYREGIYGRELSRRTYDQLRAGAESRLDRGQGVIVDATFLAPQDREVFLRLGERVGSPALFVECRTSEPEILRRLEGRASDPDEASDAGPSVYRRQSEVFVPLEEIPPARRIIADTEGDLEAVLAGVQSAFGS